MIAACLHAQPALPPPPSPPPDSSDGPPTPHQIKALIAKLNSSSQPTEQTFAQNRLVAVGIPALPYLHEELLHGRYTYSRIQITRILARIGHPSSLPVLEQTLTTPYPNLNRASVSAIVTIAGTNALAVLTRIRTTTTDTNLIDILRTEEARLLTLRTQHRPAATNTANPPPKQ